MGTKSLRTIRSERRWDNESKDQRKEFQRDRDRVLYCQEFRRLAGVSQVVHAGEGFPFHNRLTHSLKVAQVGRRLAEFLRDEHDPDEIEAVGGLSPDVVETAALAHDLGHPPFGHPAEKELDDRTLGKGVIDGFEGNAQSFRIITSIAKHKPGELQGLDLTRATLNAVLKYPRSRSAVGDARDKWGYYETEAEDFEFTQDLETPGKPDNGRSIEAELVDWADDITYAIHDVADFYRAGMIPLGELVRNSGERGDFLDAYETSNGPLDWAPEEFFEENIKKIGKLAGASAENPLLGPYRNTRSNRAALNFVSSELVERYLGVSTGVDVSLDPSVTGGVHRTAQLEREVDLLKYLSKYYVFDNPSLVSQRHGHREMIGKLFDILFDATDRDSEYNNIIPQPFFEDIEAVWTEDMEPDKERQHRARIVADVIASLTEMQSLTLYERVTGSSPGSIRDQIIG